MQKWVKRFVITLVVLYGIGCTGLYWAQEELIFHPNKIHESYKFKQGNEVEIEVEDDISLNVLHITRKNPKGVVLYLHGNKGDNRRCLHQINSFVSSAYDIVMPDYRGYGKSDGEIESEAQLLGDAQKVYDYVKKKYQESKITIVGYSLGTGMASFLGANNRPSNLVLIAPYVSFYKLKNKYAWFVPDFLVKYPLDNLSNLKNVASSITIFHGTADRVIPYDNSLQLKTEIPKIEMITLDGTSHRRSIFHDKLRRRFSKF